MGPIYLDYNATTPLDPEVEQAMADSMEEFGNPSSIHLWGANAKMALEKARRELAALIGCAPSEIVFTSGGTESNNIAIKGAALSRLPRKGHIISSRVEHPAVLRVLEALAVEADYEITLLPVDGKCRIDPVSVLDKIKENTVLVTIMHSNNEVGTIMPVKEMAEILRGRNILFHTDAAQSIGKVDINVKEMGVDLMSIAGHKFYGPKGIGALYVKNGTPIEPVLRGAGQEKGIRPGTEPTMLATGLGAAARRAKEELEAGEPERIRTLRDKLEEMLTIELPGAKVRGDKENRLPGTSSVTIPGIPAPDLVEELALQVGISAGAACHGDSREISHVLKAMGIGEDEALCTVRISVGRFTTEEEIILSVKEIAGAAGRMRKTG